MATAASGKNDDGAKEFADLESEIKQLKAELAKLAKLAQATGEHGYGTAKKAAAVGAEQLRAQGEAKFDELRASARDIEDQVLSHVREKPITSLAIAAGLGFLFALMARR